MSAQLILARQDSRPLPYPLDAYYERYATLAVEPAFADRGKVLRLPMVTVATLRYTAPDVEDLRPTTRGTTTEASILLAAWGKRRHMSAWEVAEEFQDRYFRGGTRGFTRGLEPYRNVPRKGFDLLAATDALGLVEWWCDVPSTADYRRFDTVRLKDALARVR